MRMSARLDNELVARGLLPSRSKAREAILAGQVLCDGAVCDKPARRVDATTAIELAGRVMPYVGRGGLKLERALEEWGIDLTGRTLLDIGSSTGGFTDCALQHGAARVIAVDVGTGQMAEPLRSDPRVELHEQTDFRSMQAKALAGASIAAIDVSFISVRLLVDAVAAAPDVREVVCLVKPQFECGRAEAKAHRGVVSSEAVRRQAVADVCAAFEAAGFTCTGTVPSPIAGGDGNVEFLAHFVR